MKVKFKGMLGFIDWKHQQEVRPKGKFNSLDSQVTFVPEATTCIFRDTTGRIHNLATVVKHKDDAPNRRLARKFALRKLLQETYDTNERREIWNEFLALSPKNKL